MLYRGSLKLAAYCIHQFIAYFAFSALNTDLDEFMGLQRAFDFGDDAGCEAIPGDRYDRIQMVGLGAQCATLCGGKLCHGILNCDKDWILDWILL